MLSIFRSIFTFKIWISYSEKLKEHIWAGYPPALFPFWSSTLSFLFRNLMPFLFLHILLKYFIPFPKSGQRSCLDISSCAYFRLFSVNGHYAHQVSSICYFQPNSFLNTNRHLDLRDCQFRRICQQTSSVVVICGKTMIDLKSDC